MPTLIIDGETIEAPDGMSVLEAALGRGIEIPHYCYHPALSVAGNCRMCLVEIEKAPKLAIACATPVAEGMVVNTHNDRVREAHAAVMEFLLINHPLDCPICDQAGECKLQDNAVSHGTGVSRYTEPKLALNKAVDIGRHVMLDQERCIQCSRCTRFCDEVTASGELAFFERGERAQIGIFPGRRLDNAYSGNTVDLCPVGALTLKEFRFATRVWYLKNTPTVCAGCARGCNVVVAVGTKQVEMTTRGQLDDRIKRVVPRYNAAVNGHWMCDEGRLSYERLDAAPTLMRAQAPAGSDCEWDESIRLAAARLKTAAKDGRAAALISPRLTSETMFALRRWFDALGGVTVGVSKIERGADDDLLIRADKGANAVGADWIFGANATESRVREALAAGEIDVLLVTGDALDPEDTPSVGPSERKRLSALLYLGRFEDAVAREAAVAIPWAGWAEGDGTYANFQGRIQRIRRAHLPRGEGRPGWRVVVELFAAAGLAAPDWASWADVLVEMAEGVPAYKDVDAERVGMLGVEGGAPAGAGA